VLDRPDVKVVSNPEFLREGSAVQDFLKPDRIVVGSTDQAAAIKVSSLYLGVAAPVIVTDPASAETIKYAANAFLATKLSFVNAVAAICEGVGADVNDVVLGLGYDKRIGQDFLRPGPGWGGSCFPKDTRALLKIADDAGYSFDLLQGVVAVNDEQFDRVTEKVVEAAGGDVGGKTIGVWGLTFKARTDDLRDSPSLAIIERLLAKGACVKGHDPTVTGPKAGLPEGVAICADPYEVAEGADVLVVLTEWEEYRWLDAGRVATSTRGRAVVDSRNLLDRNEYRRAGFTYAGIGR
jgi:UDPglucose 6-dehydrogenase